MALTNFQNYINLNNCRLCQINVGTIPIENDSILLEQICTVIKIEVKDFSTNFLPKNICCTCQKKVDEIQTFVKNIQMVNANLIALAFDQKKYALKDESNDLTPKLFDLCTDNESDDDLKCSKCPATFEGSKDLKEHVSSHIQSHSSEDFCCPVCSRFYRRIRRFDTHKRSHPQIYCATCDIVFESVTERLEHRCILHKTVEQNKEQKIELKLSSADTTRKFLHCDICSQKLSDKQSYIAHLKNHGKYMCSRADCFKILSSVGNLKKHISVHDGKKLFLCGTCGKIFPSKKSLTCHEKLHLDIKLYNCKTCNLSFSFRSNYRNHLRIYHEGFRFECAKCEKSYTTHISLVRHEKLHTGNKDFKCEQCEAGFFTKKELSKHFRYHMGEKKHRCGTCFKSFYDGYHLKIHQRKHTGERPYICDINSCRKSFMDSTKLNRHKKTIHT